MRASSFGAGWVAGLALCAAVFGIQTAQARQPDPAVVKQQEQVAQKTIEQVRNV